MRKPPATLALIGVSTLVYLAMTYLDQMAVIRPLLISEYADSALPEIRAGQWWRLLTPMFLHFGIFHAVFNLLWTWELGRLIEARQGTLALLGLSALIGALSNLGQYYASGPWFGGMSGVVYGYFGYLWIRGLLDPGFGIRLNPPVVYLLLGWFVLCWSGVLELFGLRVANTAHTTGLASGIALAVLFGGFYRYRLRLRRRT